MKKLFILIAVTAFFAVSCGNNSKPATHTHEDGTVHSGAVHVDDTTRPDQEEFLAEPDSLHHEHGEEGHTHDETTHKH